MQNAMENICLKQDSGPDITFHGRLFSESSWYDEEGGVLTRQKLYVTDTGEQVYYIVRSGAGHRSRRAWRLCVKGELCHIKSGALEAALPLEMLLLAVRGLCGIDSAAMPPAHSVLEEMLRAAG